MRRIIGLLLIAFITMNANTLAKSFKRYLLYAPLMLIILLSSVSCDDDNTDVIARKDETVWVGQEYSIAISGTAPFSIDSDNEQIASAIIRNNTIVINAHEKPGKTTLHIIDSSNKETIIDVYVQTLYGAWRDDEKRPLYKVEITVEAEDGKVKDSLESEMWASIEKKWKTIYGFNSRDNILEVINPQGESNKGIYSFEKEILTLEYNNSKEQYSVTLLGLAFIQLTQDLTNVYKSQYPNAGINKVIVKRYLSLISL